MEYNVRKRHFTQFSRQFENSEWKSRSYPIRNITFDPRVENIIILHDDSSIIIVDKEKVGRKIFNRYMKELTGNPLKIKVGKS